jgi:hypothetical protein
MAERRYRPVRESCTYWRPDPRRIVDSGPTSATSLRHFDPLARGIVQSGPIEALIDATAPPSRTLVMATYFDGFLGASTRPWGDDDAHAASRDVRI